MIFRVERWGSLIFSCQQGRHGFQSLSNSGIFDAWTELLGYKVSACVPYRGQKVKFQVTKVKRR